MRDSAESHLPPPMYMLRSSVYMNLRHKHLKIDQDKLDRARSLLGVKTEQETIDRALEVLLAERRIARAHQQVKGVGGFVDVFESR